MKIWNVQQINVQFNTLYIFIVIIVLFMTITMKMNNYSYFSVLQCMTKIDQLRSFHLCKPYRIELNQLVIYKVYFKPYLIT